MVGDGGHTVMVTVFLAAAVSRGPGSLVAVDPVMEDR